MVVRDKEAIKNFLRVWDMPRDSSNDSVAGIGIGRPQVPEGAPREEWSLLDAVSRLREAVRE